MRKFLKTYNYILIVAYSLMLCIKYANYLLNDISFRDYLSNYASRKYSDNIHVFTLFSSFLYWILIYNLFIK
jgi:hypothetical protein